jgi:hypothetical protein
MQHTEDRLTLLKGRYLAQIKGKEQEIEALRTKVKLLDEIDAEAQKFLSLGDNTASLKDKKLIEAALETVQAIGTNGGVTTRDVADYMRAHGFEFTGEHYLVSVATSLNRLADRGAIASRKEENGRLKFTAVKP